MLLLFKSSNPEKKDKLQSSATETSAFRQSGHLASLPEWNESENESSSEAEQEASEKVETESPVDEDTEPTYTDEELHILSRVISGEACGQSWELQIAVGSVVLNRMDDSRYPDGIYNVVFQQGQYACTWDGNYDREPDGQAIEAAEYLLRNGSQIPEDVIFQAEFTQGTGVWMQIGNQYFCYS